MSIYLLFLFIFYCLKTEFLHGKYLGYLRLNLRGLLLGKVKEERLDINEFE